MSDKKAVSAAAPADVAVERTSNCEDTMDVGAERVDCCKAAAAIAVVATAAVTLLVLVVYDGSSGANGGALFTAPTSAGWVASFGVAAKTRSEENCWASQTSSAPWTGRRRRSWVAPRPVMQ